jgi:hypothetical protein
MPEDMSTAHNVTTEPANISPMEPASKQKANIEDVNILSAGTMITTHNVPTSHIMISRPQYTKMKRASDKMAKLRKTMMSERYTGSDLG